MGSRYIHKSHNVWVLIYHLVCAAKYRRVVMSVTAREVFAKAPEVKEELWDGAFLGKGYFVNTVRQHSSESAAYIANQGKEANYKQLHKGQLELGLF